MTEATPLPLRRARQVRTVSIALLIVAALVGLLLAGARFGVLLPQTRLLIEAGADGLKVGRFGRLKIEGLSGDIWRDVGVRKLTIRDEKGVWLEADNLHMTWSYLELLTRNFHASRIEAQAIRVLRRPTLTKKGKDTGLPVSFHIDSAKARVELTPDFSYERGLYDVGLNLDVERSGDQRGQVRVASVLHPGDYLNVDYDLAKTRPLVLRIDGEEAQGGALAGAIGLSAKQPFLVEVTAGGRLSEGSFTAFANSGSLQPLKMQGAWTKDGGEARGAVSLTASALTAPYAARFGPRASFVLAGRRAGSDLFAFDGRVASENLSLRATGLGDLGERRLGPQGLALTAETAALSKITGGPDIGPTRIVGRINQAKAGWAFAGSAAVSRAGVGQYALAQASGPLEIAEAAGQWDIKTRLAGAGGRGTGYLAALLAGRPGPVSTARGWPTGGS